MRTRLTMCGAEAIDLLAFANDAAKVLPPLATDETNQDVRLRAIAALAKSQDIEPWQELLARFYGKRRPPCSGRLFDGVFASAERIGLLLDDIAAGQDQADRGRSRAGEIAFEAQGCRDHEPGEENLLAAAVPADREKVLAEYQPVLKLKAEPARGAAVFENRCSICHKIGDVGVQFAPDISDSRERTPDAAAHGYPSAEPGDRFELFQLHGDHRRRPRAYRRAGGRDIDVGHAQAAGREIRNAAAR